MSTIEIVSKIESLKEWEALAAEAAAEIESIKDEIKRHMDGMGLKNWKRDSISPTSPPYNPAALIPNASKMKSARTFTAAFAGKPFPEGSPLAAEKKSATPTDQR